MYLIKITDDVECEEMNDVQDCAACSCDAGGSTDRFCDKETGACPCRPYLTGRQCSQPVDYHYIPSVDALAVKPTSSSCRSEVDLPRSDVTGPGGYFLLCEDGQEVSFSNISVSLPNVTW